jgi:hypothetical protein
VTSVDDVVMLVWVVVLDTAVVVLLVTVVVDAATVVVVVGAVVVVEGTVVVVVGGIVVVVVGAAVVVVAWASLVPSGLTARQAAAASTGTLITILQDIRSITFRPPVPLQGISQLFRCPRRFLPASRKVGRERGLSRAMALFQATPCGCNAARNPVNY